jgi:IS605 OrfB family transposase
MGSEYTYEAKFSRENYPMLEEYYGTYVFSIQSRVFHRAFKDLQAGKSTSELRKSSGYCGKFNLSGRTINSIARQAQGTIVAAKALQPVTISAITGKIAALELVIGRLNRERSALIADAVGTALSKSQVTQLHTIKQKLYYKHNRLNRLKQSLQRQQSLKDRNRLRLCFGSRRLFRAQYNLKANGFNTHADWLRAWRKARSHSARYLGATAETCQNQECQLHPVGMASHVRHGRKLFALKVRTIPDYEKATGRKHIILPGLTFGYGEDRILHCLHYKDSPITIRIIKRHNDWYLQASLQIMESYESRQTTGIGGTVGLDYNAGFIQACETDRYGNIVGFRRIRLKRHGTGKAAETELKQAVSAIITDCRHKGKDIAIESLNFTAKKFGLQGNKRYNKMLSEFDYARYQEAVERAAYRQNVYKISINPAYTSKQGQERYSKARGCNIHQGAAYVIARVAQGFNETYITKSNKAVKIKIA